MTKPDTSRMDPLAKKLFALGTQTMIEEKRALELLEEIHRQQKENLALARWRQARDEAYPMPERTCGR